MRKPKILSVRIEHRPDESPDLSWLGEYSNKPGANAIDRKERGDIGRNELRYCNITLSADETGNPESVEQDYQRLESYNRGDWGMVGIIAKAEVQFTDGGPIQTLHSGGLWEVESDSEPAHIRGIEKEQLADLREQLTQVGFTGRQVNAAIGKVGA